MIGQFDHWATPYAKDLKAPSLNGLAPMNSTSPTPPARAPTWCASRCGSWRGWPCNDPLCDDRRPAPLRRLPDLHGRLQATPTPRRPACSGASVLDIESGEFPDVRRTFVPVGLHALRQPALR
jgi:hypothetical protein